MPAPPLVRTLDATVRTLLGPLLELSATSRTGWRLVGWDVEQGVSLTLSHGDDAFLVELQPRDELRDCYFRTSRFNISVRSLFRGNEPLNPEQRRAFEQLIGVIKQRELLLIDLPRPAPERGSEVREITVERVLMVEAPGRYYINPYAGCMIGCPFCYVAPQSDLSRALEGRSQLPWGRYVDVKVNAPDVLREEVRHVPPGIVRMSPILTDPYQPLERTYRVTRRCIEVLVEHGFTPVVLTRAARVTDDLDLLAHSPRSAVGLSIPTDDDAVRVRFEPGADPVEARFEALAACHRAGVRTFGVIQPMLPMDPLRMVERMAPYVRAMRIDRMHEVHRTMHVYEALGRRDATTDEWFAHTAAMLRAGFGAHGVPVDERDDLGGLIDGT